jgi:hypothetical protein
MVATTQIEAKLAFEPNSTPGDVTYGNGTSGGNSVPRESNRPDFIGNSANDSGAAPASRGDEAFQIDLSEAAQQIGPTETGDAARDRPQLSTTNTQPLEATIESSGTAVIGGTADPTADIAADASNQVASIGNEQAGNDTSNRTEAGRTLGQVIDTFA